MKKDDLLKRCINGDREAWEQFADKYRRLIEYVIVQTMKSYGVPYNATDVEDIFGNVFYSLLNNNCSILRRYDPKYSFTNWLSMVSRSRSIDFFRKKKGDRSLSSLGQGEDGEQRDASGLFASDVDSPEEGSIKEELRAEMRHAMKQLPQRDRLMLKLFFYEDKKYREIADILGMSLSMVASNIYRAKVKMMNIIKQEVL